MNLRCKVINVGLRDAILTPPHQDYTCLLFSSEPEMDPDWLDRLLHQRNTNKPVEPQL